MAGSIHRNKPHVDTVDTSHTWQGAWVLEAAGTGAEFVLKPSKQMILLSCEVTVGERGKESASTKRLQINH